jgi:hypothetical protein
VAQDDRPPIEIDRRRVERDPACHILTAFGPDARELSLCVEDISPHGLMARYDRPLRVGDRLRARLPLVGMVVMEVRWCRDDRIGCRFDQAIDRATFYELLSIMLRPPPPGDSANPYRL